MNGPNHYLNADRLLTEACHAADRDDAAFFLAQAQVHATLALVAATLHSGSNNRNYSGSETHPQEWREATR